MLIFSLQKLEIKFHKKSEKWSLMFELFECLLPTVKGLLPTVEGLLLTIEGLLLKCVCGGAYLLKRVRLGVCC